ncbi:hypothetical protein AB1Y20_010653 [Prymnesium parvum]|uniref:Vacuolar protein 8 n=1 Tax=Prymnesium parvum TaxID=97485 RepID=A0AB34IRE1_PRYPA|mmetsp:Transcript_18413/g.46113  ORF Transcript_18413/g.46113 Transcript_18413/m.46113 type:complete len:331 (-) Transcript_18413:339-1331(-)
MRALRALRAALLAAVLVGLSESSAAPEDGSERMRVEMDSAGVQTADMAAKEAEAKAGMAEELKDTLTDIMAVLQHGSDPSKDQAIGQLVQIALQTSEAGSEQARMFRSAVVAGGALPSLIAVLRSDDATRQFLGVRALHALAIDDPTTELDNFHSEEICQHGAVPLLVRALSSEVEQLQAAATGALAQLAENPTCQRMIVAEGAVKPLVGIASYADDMQKLGAMNALDVLAINNAKAREQLQASGAAGVLKGIGTLGSGLLREQAIGFGERLQGRAEPLSPEAHVQAARKTRIQYDSVRHRAMEMMRGWADSEGGRGMGRGRGRGRGSPS